MKQKESVKSLFIRNLNFKCPFVIAVYQIFNVSRPLSSDWLYREFCSKTAFLVKKVKLATARMVTLLRDLITILAFLCMLSNWTGGRSYGASSLL